ncbi:MAG TPA: S-layer family protein, partial [Allocoleopsis sp.]
LVGAVDPFSSAIVSSVQPGATWSGGNITLETRQLSLRDGASISAATLGQGTAGDVFINAADSVELIGATGQMPTNLTAQTQASGNAGNLTLITNTLLIQDQAGLSVSSQGTGSAGNLTIDADTIALDRGIIAATTGGTGLQSGALINLRNLQLLTMENGSVISARATDRANGGSISIEANEGLVVATPTENNDIIASADQGNGGNIDIRTQGIFGLQPSAIDTPNSDINASSRFGLDGVVQLDTSDTNPTRGLTELPTDVVDASSQIAQTCPTNAADTQNEFIVTGRGGLPPNPLEVLDGDAIQVDLVTRNIPQPSDPDASSGLHLPDSAAQPVVEAQGWIVDAKGEVMLTATAPTTALSQSWTSSSNCLDQASESRL